MERVRVNSLVPGTKLTQPLYDSDRRLLVGPGNRLTAETFRSLARSSTEYVYLGEWDQADFEGFQKRSISLEDYRRQADEAAAVLEAEIERELGRIELDVKPGLRALENRVDNSLLVARPSERIRQWHALHDRGVNVVEQIFEGQIDADEIGDVAGAMVDEVIAAFVKDRSLLANLTNLRKLSGYLYAHSMNVTVLSVQIASALKYDAVQVKSVGIAALLQDFGMAMAPEELVNLPRTLTREEKLCLQKHSIHGLYAIMQMRGLPYIARYIAYQCHERGDRSGYPNRRPKSLTHRFAQIVAVADVYDALASERPWRKAYSPYHAMEYVVKEAAAGKFDQEIVRALLNCVSLFPIGSMVRISNGETGRIVHANGADHSRPVVSVLFSAGGDRLAAPRIVDLAQEEDIRIETIVPAPAALQNSDGF